MVAGRWTFLIEPIIRILIGLSVILPARVLIRILRRKLVSLFILFEEYYTLCVLQVGAFDGKLRMAPLSKKIKNGVCLTTQVWNRMTLCRVIPFLLRCCGEGKTAEFSKKKKKTAVTGCTACRFRGKPCGGIYRSAQGSFAKSQTTCPGYWVAKSQITRRNGWLDLSLYGRCDENERARLVLW